MREIRAAFPELFYRSHVEWFDGEEFMDVEPRRISEWFWTSTVPTEDNVRAVDLAALYVKRPEMSAWRKFLWTCDIDRWGNRVYVSGVGAYGIDAFQIHRKLEPECYWVGAA